MSVPCSCPYEVHASTACCIEGTYIGLHHLVMWCMMAFLVRRGRGRGRGRGARELAALVSNRGGAPAEVPASPSAAAAASSAQPAEGVRPSQYRGVTQERRTGNWRGQLWLSGKVGPSPHARLGKKSSKCLQACLSCLQQMEWENWQ